MKNIHHLLLFSLILLMSGACAPIKVKQAQGAEITAYAPVYPVLVGKTENPVFRIQMHLPEDRDVAEVQELSLDLSGTTDLADIEAIQVFYTGRKTEFAPESRFGTTSEISRNIRLSGSQNISGGTHNFWVSVTLHAGADLDHTIALAVPDLVVDRNKWAVPPAVPNPPRRIGLALRRHNEDQVHTYRIPGLATTNKGTLIAVYDMRYTQSGDLQEDIDVGMSRSTDGGRTWEPMKVIMDRGEWGGLSQQENGIGDPCVLIDRETNTIWVAALWVHGHGGKPAWFASEPGLEPLQTGQFLLTKSEDDGLTWSEPVNITSQIKDKEWHLLLDGPGKGIYTSNGTLIFPAQFKDENEVPHATIVYSKDRGNSWSIGTGAKSRTTEAQVVELSDHALMLNMRDDRGSGEGKGTGARSVMITRDLGQTWTEHATSRQALPEPVCMASLIKHRYQGRDLLLFSNPDDQYIRRNLTIKVSEDDGLTWHEKYFTRIDEGQGRGYSCLTTIDENTIGIVYEGSQADLVFQRLSMKDLMKD